MGRDGGHLENPGRKSLEEISSPKRNFVSQTKFRLGNENSFGVFVSQTKFRLGDENEFFINKMTEILRNELLIRFQAHLVGPPVYRYNSFLAQSTFF